MQPIDTKTAGIKTTRANLDFIHNPHFLILPNLDYTGAGGYRDSLGYGDSLPNLLRSPFSFINDLQEPIAPHILVLIPAKDIRKFYKKMSVSLVWP